MGTERIINTPGIQASGIRRPKIPKVGTNFAKQRAQEGALTGKQVQKVSRFFF